MQAVQLCDVRYCVGEFSGKRLCGLELCVGKYSDQINVLGRSLDKTEQRKRSATDRHNFEFELPILKKLAQRLQGALQGVSIVHCTQFICSNREIKVLEARG